MMNQPILKQYSKFKEEDFADFPIWLCVHGVDEDQPWHEHTDEVTYRPYDRVLPYDRSNPVYPDVAVRTLFTMAGRTSLPGFVTVLGAREPFAHSPSYIHPRLFLPSGITVSLYHPWQDAAEKAMETLLTILDVARSQAFPIRYEVPDGIVSPPLRGELASIYYRSGREDVPL